MNRRQRSLNRRIGRKTAFLALFNAFKWLADNAASSHRVEWLGEYPLLSTSSPRNAFLTLRFLCHNRDETGGEELPLDPATYAALMGHSELAKRLAGKELFLAFTYFDSSCFLQESSGEVLHNQQQVIRDLFSQRYGQENLLLVRSDSLHTNGYNSIRESITNLISAEFFMSRGYMVVEDTGSGPDVIAFKSRLLEDLRERRFIGKGAGICELATIRAFGRVNQSYREDIPKDEVIAVESESVNPHKGINQLRRGYESKRFAYLGFFDRRVLAAPFLNQGATNLDILTYDANGLEYRESGKAGSAPDFWKSKKLAFMEELHTSMKTMLLLNLTFEEMAGMVSSKHATAFQVLHDIPKLGIEKILDKIESVM